MRFTTDYSTLARILLGVGALSFLPLVEADFAQCVPGWEWVRSSTSLACRALKANPFMFPVVQFRGPKSL